MKKLLCTLLALPLLASAATIHMIGDSTMCNYSKKFAPRTGWGTAMMDKVTAGNRVLNRAKSGTSSKSYRTPQNPDDTRRQYWSKVVSSLKKGDFVIIQFGLADSLKGKQNEYRYSDPDTDFQANLKGFIGEVRAKGATPILCTQTVVCRVNKKGAVFNLRTYNKYVEATKKVAAETGCEIVDLNGAALKKLNEMGSAEAEKLYMMDAAGRKNSKGNLIVDRTHFNDKGAEFYAALFVELAKAQDLSIAKILK